MAATFQGTLCAKFFCCRLKLCADTWKSWMVMNIAAHPHFARQWQQPLLSNGSANNHVSTLKKNIAIMVGIISRNS